MSGSCDDVESSTAREKSECAESSAETETEKSE